MVSLKAIFLIAVVLLIAISALIGNGFICYTIKRDSKLHTSTFVLIVGQAISDMMYGVSFVIIMLVCSEWFLQNVIGGETICSFFSVLVLSSYVISSLTMTVIAIERYILIFYPLKPKLTIRQAWFLNTAIYMSGILIALAGQVGFTYSALFGKVSKKIGHDSETNN